MVTIVALASCGRGESSESGPATGVGCENETRADRLAAGMKRTGAAGYTVAVADMSPAPPTKGDNAWKLEVLDPAGQVRTDLRVRVTPWMPDHGHGTTITPRVEAPAAESRAFAISRINLWMPGLWRVGVAVTDGERQLDEVHFFTCIDG